MELLSFMIDKPRKGTGKAGRKGSRKKRRKVGREGKRKERENNVRKGGRKGPELRTSTPEFYFHFLGT